jgi:ATP-dependent exoDNAse (exonuclease V) beta subunit
LHKAKGLEFLHVFLPAFEAGIIPSSYGDVDEERRLAYVALTRGMRQVRISWALYRRGPTEPSPFVDAIPERSRVFLSRLNQKTSLHKRERAYVTSLAACVATTESGRRARRCERCSILLPPMNLHRRQPR